MQGFAVRSIPANPPRKGSSKNSIRCRRSARRGFHQQSTARSWVCLPAAYDDAGFSDTMMDRSALHYFARLVRLSYLPLDITQAILDGRQPADLTADKLLAHSRLPLAWHDQRNVLGFA